MRFELNEQRIALVCITDANIDAQIAKLRASGADIFAKSPRAPTSEVIAGMTET
jgi:hypothetical protein